MYVQPFQKLQSVKSQILKYYEDKYLAIIVFECNLIFGTVLVQFVYPFEISIKRRVSSIYSTCLFINYSLCQFDNLKYLRFVCVDCFLCALSKKLKKILYQLISSCIVYYINLKLIRGCYDF